MRITRPVLAAVVLCLLPAAARAQQTPAWTDHDLATFASVVITGRVVASTAAWDPAVRSIYTYSTIEVDEVWKGQLDSDRIVVKTLGGRVADLELTIHGQATLTPATDVLLWLEVRPRDGTLYPAALAQGVREITPFTDLATLRAIAQASTMPLTRAISATPQEFREASPDRPLDFTLLPVDSGSPARWHDSDAGTPVRVDYQVPPSGLGGGVTEISAALNLWNNAGMALQLQLGSTRAGRCLLPFEGDGRISIAFNDPCGDISDSGSIVGLGGGYHTPGDRRTINGVTFEKFVQGIVILNNSAGAFTFLSQRGCFQDALTHNIGHAFGLGHATTNTSIMWRDPLPGCSSAPSSLGVDDFNGARFIYPFGVGTGVPGTPRNLSAAVNGTTVTLTWQPALSGGSVTTWVLEAGSNTGLSDLAIVPTGTQTSVTFTGVPSGYYYLRIRGRNALGTGSPSNEIEVPVNCPAPAPPRNFAFTRSGTTLTFSWAPPLTGGALAYRGEFGNGPGLANLLVAEVPGSILGGSISAPRGTYYARLRTRGTCGLSAVSNELTIVVP